MGQIESFRRCSRPLRAARAETGFVVVSIFVNPTQFGANEDIDRYPRQLEAEGSGARGVQSLGRVAFG